MSQTEALNTKFPYKLSDLILKKESSENRRLSAQRFPDNLFPAPQTQDQDYIEANLPRANRQSTHDHVTFDRR